MSKLYYTVEKQTQTIDTVEECTGWKTIIVYEIANDRPKEWFTLENVSNEESSQKAIEEYLEDNGFGDRNYDFIWL